MRTRHARTAAFVATCAVFVAACGGSDPSNGAASPTSPTTDSVTTTTASTTTTTTTPPTTTTERGTTTMPPATSSPDDGRCLVGDWVVTDDQMNTFYAQLTSSIDTPDGVEVEIVVSGSAGLSFRADGTYQWTPDFDLMLRMDSVAGATGGVGRTEGTIDGTWTAADGVVTTASEVNSVDMTITVNGTTVDGSEMANGMLNASPVNGVTYSCAGSAPVLDFVTSDPAVTVPITLTPA